MVGLQRGVQLLAYLETEMVHPFEKFFVSVKQFKVVVNGNNVIFQVTGVNVQLIQEFQDTAQKGVDPYEHNVLGLVFQ